MKIYKRRVIVKTHAGKSQYTQYTFTTADGIERVIRTGTVRYPNLTAIKKELNCDIEVIDLGSRTVKGQSL